jgi:hypothetical protein
VRLPSRRASTRRCGELKVIGFFTMRVVHPSQRRLLSLMILFYFTLLPAILSEEITRTDVIPHMYNPQPTVHMLIF